MGQEGMIMGLADAAGKWLFMKADVERGDGSGVAEGLQQRINAKNVTLTEVYNMRALQDVMELMEPESQESSESGSCLGASSSKHVPKWALLDSEPQQVILQKKWAELLVHDDDLNRRSWGYGRIHVILHSLYETLPTYSNKEIMVLTRANSKGAWATEVWTLKDFEAGEIIFAPSVLADKGLAYLSAGPRRGGHPCPWTWLSPRWPHLSGPRRPQQDDSQGGRHLR